MNIMLCIEKSYRYSIRLAYMLVYKSKGLKFNKNCYMGRGIRFNNANRIKLSDKISIADGVRMWSEVCNPETELVIDSGVQINRNVLLDFTGSLQIKRGTLISEDSILYTHSHGYDPRSTPKSTSLVIEEDVWIGSRALILPSVGYIGARSIIGAGAVVSKNIPPDSIVVSQSPRVYQKV